MKSVICTVFWMCAAICISFAWVLTDEMKVVYIFRHGEKADGTLHDYECLSETGWARAQHISTLASKAPCFIGTYDYSDPAECMVNDRYRTQQTATPLSLEYSTPIDVGRPCRNGSLHFPSNWDQLSSCTANWNKPNSTEILQVYNVSVPLDVSCSHYMAQHVLSMECNYAFLFWDDDHIVALLEALGIETVQMQEDEYYEIMIRSRNIVKVRLLFQNFPNIATYT